MKIVIAGGRDYTPHPLDRLKIRDILLKNNASEIISGGAKGADKWGEYIACWLNIPVKVFQAQWNKYGIKAGPIRNSEMAKYCDAVILMPGGKGTMSMRNEAKKAGKPILYDSGIE